MTAKRGNTDALPSLREHEDAEFVRHRPRSRKLLERGRGADGLDDRSLRARDDIFPVAGDGAYFEDVDGRRYLDMNQVDIAGFIGFAPG